MNFSRSAGGVNKPLHRALLLSVVGHVVLFVGFESNLERSVSESGVSWKKLQIVTFRLRHPRQPGEEVVAAPSKAALPSRVHTNIGRGSATVVTDSPASRVNAAAPARLLESIDAVRAEKSAVVRSEEALSVPAAETPAGRGSEAVQTSSEDLRSYRVALASQARRFRVYPASARDNGVGGRSEVEVLLLPSSAPMLRVVKTSGYEVLDQAALEMLRRSMESVPLPRGLVGQRVSFSLPVEFVPPQ